MEKTIVIVLQFFRMDSGKTILGVSLLDRFLKAGKKAGFTRQIILEKNEPVSFSGLVLIPSLKALFLQTGWEKLESSQPESESIYLGNNNLFCLLNTADGKAAQLFASSDTFDLAAERLKKEFGGLVAAGLAPARHPQGVQLHLDEKDYVLAEKESDVPEMEKRLLRSLIKDTEGFMSRHFERKISLVVTKQLISTKITPNTMTLISVLIGIAGGVCFLPGNKIYDVVGAVLFWLHSVLDGCDGEIARLKFMESKWGGILDFWGDNLVHSVIFAAIAVALRHKLQTFWPIGLGFCAVLGTVFSAFIVYWKTMRSKAEKGPLFTSVASGKDTAAKKIADYLARRDFIYLVIVLAALDRIELFLWMGAIGAPIYFLVLVWFNSQSRT